MKILVTGGAGYIGSLLCAYLVHNGHEVYVIDNFMYWQGPLVFPALLDTKFSNRSVNLIDWKHGNETLQLVDVVIPLAAIVGAPACDKSPEEAKATNLESIKQLLSGLRNDQLVIFPNTNSGYGSCPDAICTEETPLTPISLYGNTKDAAEHEVSKYKNSIRFRLATVFGVSARHRLDLLINTLVYEAVIKKKIVLFDDSFMRNYIHIRDICSAFLFAIDNADKMRGEVYNLGNDSLNMSKGDLVYEISKKLDFELEKSTQTDPDKRNYVVSSQKLYDLGYEPKYDLAYGIEELKAFYLMCGPDNPIYNLMKNI